MLSRYRRVLLVILVLLVVSPLFGVIGAKLVGYHEPLDVAAEKLGLKEVSIYWTPFEDYSVPGLPEAVGYVVAGAIGVAVILGIGVLLSRLGGRR